MTVKINLGPGRPQPFTCPQCGYESSYDPEFESAYCPQCGYRPPAVDDFTHAQRQALGISRYYERCRREIGRKLLTCQERASGNCPFILEKGDASSGCMKVLGIGMLLYAAVLIIGLINPGEEEPPLCLAAIFLPFFVFIGSGLVFGKRQTLRNPTTGQFWQRHTVLGIETDRKLITGLESPTLNLTLPRSFEDPTSIAALEDETRKPTGFLPNWAKYAAEIFTDALVGMLAEGSIEVRYAKTQRSYLMSRYVQRDEYLIVSGEGGHPFQPRAYLEERILTVVAYDQPYYTPIGIGIYDLVRAVFDRDRANPGYWLVQRVMDDAVERGYGSITGSGRRLRFNFRAGYLTRMRAQGESLRVLYDQLEKTHPSLMTAFRVQIRRGIQSRTETTD